MWASSPWAPKPGVNVQTADYYTMSDFSSWGIPGSLELKPEITAPGGNIYSLQNGGGYQNMSGTSMASPQVAGMAAVVAQYVRANKLTEKTGLTARALAQSLLMSTAVPMYQDYGEGKYGYYSVMQQGAGLANVALPFPPAPTSRWIRTPTPALPTVRSRWSWATIPPAPASITSASPSTT